MFQLAQAEGSQEVKALCFTAAQVLEGMMHPRSLPITSVSTYLGAAEVPPLDRPRMCSVLDPAPPKGLSSVPHVEPLTAVPQPSPVLKPAPAPEPKPGIPPNSKQPVAAKPRQATAKAEAKTAAAKAFAATLAAGAVSQKKGLKTSEVVPAPPSVPAPPVEGDESSDSEGSLPDIDSGDGDE